MEFYCETYHEKRDSEHCCFCSAICGQYPNSETNADSEKKTMRQHMDNEILSKRYIESLKKAYPDLDKPTWEMLGIAFLDGMEEQRRTEELKKNIRNCGTVNPEEILDLARKFGIRINIDLSFNS